MRLLILAVTCLSASQHTLFGTTAFTFDLNASYITSAGVYKPDGTLVRTLWRKVAYGPGSTTRTWDDKDDGGKLLPVGHYQIKVLYHNTQYIFDGMIGNTSSPSAGRSVFYGSNSMHNLAIAGNSAFYANGINEGRHTMHYFNTTNPGQQTDIGHPDYLMAFDQVAADEDHVYFGGRNSGFNPNWGGYYTFVTAFRTTVDPVTGTFPPLIFAAGVARNTNLPPNSINPEDYNRVLAEHH